MDLVQALAREAPLVLDGGLSTALREMGLDLSDHLWTARALLESPEAVREAHLAYFRAGARVAITASYQVSLQGFAAAGLGRRETEDALRASVRLAQEARQQAREEGAREPLLVAASVGPYGAVLAGGQEYTGDYGPGMDRRALVEFHRPRLEILAEAGADLLAVETIPSVREAEAILEALGGIPEGRAWVSFACSAGGRTGAGDDLAEAAALVRGVPPVVAVGVNCTAPEHVAAALDRLSPAWAPLVAYPNDGRAWDASRRRLTGRPGAGLEAGLVRSWVERGVRLVGGCCGIGPTEIARLAAALARPAGHGGNPPPSPRRGPGPW